MELVPEYIRKLKIYSAGKSVAELLREKNLRHISKLASNENPLGPPPASITSMMAELKRLNHYPDMHGTELKSKLAQLYHLKTSNIILGNGSEGIMAYIVRTFLRPGDEVFTSEKTFIGFNILARGAGIDLKEIPLTNSFHYDIKKIAEQVNDKTKVIYIANPNNPTGNYITENEFLKLVKRVAKHTLIILDEAYFEYAQNAPNYPDSMKYRFDNVITLRTFSKAYGLAGIRVGYGFAHEDLISNLTKIKLPFEPNSCAQTGAIAAINDSAHLQKTLENNSARYEETIKFLQENNFSFIDSVANFVAFKTGSADASWWIYQNLLNEGVIIRPLVANNMPTFVRVSMGTAEEMQHFFSACQKILPEFNRLFR